MDYPLFCQREVSSFHFRKWKSWNGFLLRPEGRVQPCSPVCQTQKKPQQTDEETGRLATVKQCSSSERMVDAVADRKAEGVDMQQKKRQRIELWGCSNQLSMFWRRKEQMKSGVQAELEVNQFSSTLSIINMSTFSKVTHSSQNFRSSKQQKRKQSIIYTSNF